MTLMKLNRWVERPLRLIAYRAAPLRAVALLMLHLSGLAVSGQAIQEQTPDQLKAEVTHVDTSNFPNVRVYVSISDEQGSQLGDGLPVKLTLSENGRSVAEKVLSGGHKVYTVLVIDTSASMAGEKLRKAQEAAVNYVEMSPPNFQTACVRFSSNASVISRFEESRATTREMINSLVADGQTALQDGVGQALDLLKGREGRKAIVLLTDGLENASSIYPKQDGGPDRLIRRAAGEGSSIFTVGLGGDADENYLRHYELTGGAYLFSPTADELRGVFAKVVRLLEKEHVIEYVSPSREFDGTVRNFSAQLKVGDASTSSSVVSHPIFGVIPNVSASLGPYALVFLVLLLTPPLFGFGRALAAVSGFRSASVARLKQGSKHIGRSDLNGQTLKQDDIVVVCPMQGCNRPHHIRSWRLNRCRCMNEPGGSGHYCYSRLLPRSLRYALYRWLGEPEGADGRHWLCWCAGDEKGY